VMGQYRRDYPVCELTEYPKVQVHHIKSVCVWPEGAWEYDNMVSLCKTAHFVIGHCNDSWTTYNPNVKELIIAAKPFFTVVKTVKAGSVFAPEREEVQSEPYSVTAAARMSCINLVTHVLRHAPTDEAVVILNELAATFDRVDDAHT